MEFDGFEWDAGNWAKCQKHGLAINEIEAVFRAPVYVVPDPAHSRFESRFIALGWSPKGRAVFMVFTERPSGGQKFIRLISARYMHEKEYNRHAEILAALKV